MKPGDSRLRVAVQFDEPLFARIKKRALKENKTFSEMVCELCSVGLLDLEDNDQHEVNAIEGTKQHA